LNFYSSEEINGNKNLINIYTPISRIDDVGFFDVLMKKDEKIANLEKIVVC